MAAQLPGTVTRLLEDIRQGDLHAQDQPVQVIYTELHRLAEGSLRRERIGHTLHPTDLLHEVFLRLLEDDVLSKAHNRAYLFGAASRAMRRILVDYARTRAAAKRGGNWQRTSLDDILDNYESKRIDLLALHEALESLQALNPRQRQIVDEHHFGGFTMREIGEHLGVSEATVWSDFKRAQLWLAAQLGQED
jgi:RNA polymerase sigma factor (TIGR02999 family)